MKKKKIIIFILILALAATGAAGAGRVLFTTGGGSSATLTMVIDAGHGGMDPGAVAEDGTVEKDISLAVAEALRQEAEELGIHVIMTRENDDGLYPEGDTTLRWTKLSDLNERKRIIREAAPDLTVSIHLNSYTADASVRGAQIFYPDEASKLLAENLQAAIEAGVQDGTDRTALSKKDMYLFQNMEGKRILAECGFLSNPVDLANLKQAEHRGKIAESMIKSIAGEWKLKVQKKTNSKVIDSRTSYH